MTKRGIQDVSGVVEDVSSSTSGPASSIVDRALDVSMALGRSHGGPALSCEMSLGHL